MRCAIVIYVIMAKTKTKLSEDLTIAESVKLESGAILYPVVYNDIHEQTNPDLRKAVAKEIHEQLIPAMEEHKKNRGQNYKYAEDNHVTQGLFSQSSVLEKWRQSMPTAEALYPLQKPHHKKLADGTLFDEAAERYFPHALDGVGLRSRACIMSHVMYEHFKGRKTSTTHPLKWASLACGAAIPVFDAASQLLSEGKHISLLLADIDPKALQFAKKLAVEDYDIHKHITLKKSNILRLKRLQRRVGKNSQDAIDILGFFEYIPANKWPYRKYKMKIMMPGAIEFLRTAYSLLKPGGLLVLGNMRDSHPQLVFTTQIVRWPYIRPRSLERVMDIITQAGIQPEHVTLYQAGDNVYTVAAITKPF